jgi:copper chaperone CopZ
MKNILRVTALLLVLLVSDTLKAQAPADTVSILTTAICSSCKNRIENDLTFEAGVRKVVMDLETKKVLVVYNPKKTNPDKIRHAITRIGYDADSLKADPKAFMRLPECCRNHDAEHPH